MRIDFFEEFPTEESLRKAKLVDFESTVYIAAKSIAEFRQISDKIKEINPNIEPAYWPILEKSYWISPFSFTKELKTLAEELKLNDKQLKVLIDLELPTLRKWLFIRNLLSFFRNKKLIKNIFKSSGKWNIEIVTAEYPIAKKWLRLLGVSYNPEKYPHKKALMAYSSFAKSRLARKQLRNHFIKECRKYSCIAGIGTIAVGIFGNEPILSPAELDEDLAFLKEKGIENAVIFRLAGLNEEYIKIIKKYTG
jgi:hypothetical protein